ncbi:MAG: flavodoxin-dependent (E)-4-hydroxy-3-methylbut-2-enyl-diphosphate synthase, partial [Victivallaceae bacterium]|nr:flavodoxin-dependent (E)-4-hydroxy-3-methylbut-2-enyl-diphosphate synthase [Victivallaceae bacterium]
EDAVRQVAEAARKHGTVIRVGANSGSLAKSYRLKLAAADGARCTEILAEALAQSAREQCLILEKFGVEKIKVSIKGSDVPSSTAAARMFAAATDYPLHLGVTEAGFGNRARIKSAIGIGSLLLDGIGDTIRVSLSEEPEAEVIAAMEILQSCQLRESTGEIISCPTCGRTEVDLFAVVRQVEELTTKLRRQGVRLPARIAVMGCPVNGPGEAKGADVGLAGGRDAFVLFREGRPLGVYPEKMILAKLEETLREMAERNS